MGVRDAVLFVCVCCWVVSVCLCVGGLLFSSCIRLCSMFYDLVVFLCVGFC